MNPSNTLTIPARVDVDPMELLIPEPIEAWTLVDFAGLRLIPFDDSDFE